MCIKFVLPKMVLQKALFFMVCVDHLPAMDLANDRSPAKFADLCKTLSFSSSKIMSGFKFNILNKYYKILLLSNIIYFYGGNEYLITEVVLIPFGAASIFINR